jgi:hypothetical protein
MVYKKAAPHYKEQLYLQFKFYHYLNRSIIELSL